MFAMTCLLPSVLYLPNCAVLAGNPANTAQDTLQALYRVEGEGTLPLAVYHCYHRSTTICCH